MCEFEISQIVDQAMARYGNGRDLVAASEVIDLLLDIRLLVEVSAKGSIRHADEMDYLSEEAAAALVERGIL